MQQVDRSGGITPRKSNFYCFTTQTSVAATASAMIQGSNSACKTGIPTKEEQAGNLIAAR
jgi:hypothetical protein